MNISNKFMTVISVAALIIAANNQVNAAEIQDKKPKVKDLQERIQALEDSLNMVRAQLDTLEAENLRYRVELSLNGPEGDEESFYLGDMEEFALSDSLLDIRYAEQMARQYEDEIYDMEEVRFESNVSDEIYIERIRKMNSFIQIPYNDIVRNYIIMYSEKMPKRMPYMLGMCRYYMPIFAEIFERKGLPEELQALAIIESAMDPRAESRVGAKGMWQFMYGTGKTYGLHVDSFVDERMDPVKSCEAAADYLMDAYEMFGDWNLAIASYNCGAGNVRKAIKRAGGSTKFWDIWDFLPRETRTYVPAFVGALYTLEYYKEHGIKPIDVGMPVAVDTLVINKQLHLQQVTDLTGAPLQQLKDLNPQYRHAIIPGHEREYILRLPYQYTGTFIEYGDSIYRHKANVYFEPATIKKLKDAGDGVRIVYKVKNGDYLGKIASQHRVSVANIKKWNKLKSDNIRVGQHLVIYRGGRAPASSSSSSSSASKSSSAGKPAGNSAAGAKGHSTYTVKSGDSFYSIAKNYPGVSAKNIMDYNGIKSTNIKPGTVIKIPQF